MAKGNLFQGMARGKVGDVVFSRANGEQISRVRNRHPRNPRTDAQLFQRAIMATIVQAYSAGKEIFDHAFQGFSVGAQNQREFIKRNAKLLREMVAADINGNVPTTQQLARVVAPGVSVPVPNAYLISKGTYTQRLFTRDNTTFKMPATQENETVIHYADRVNLIPGDIYTFILFMVSERKAYESNLYTDIYASQQYCDFGFVRFIAKDVSGISDALTHMGQLFDIETGGNVLSADEIGNEIAPGAGITIGELMQNGVGYTETGGIGVIRSRRDQDLRSESRLYVNYGTTVDDTFGIAPTYLLDEWAAGTAMIGSSELILEGGDV